MENISSSGASREPDTEKSDVRREILRGSARTLMMEREKLKSYDDVEGEKLSPVPCRKMWLRKCGERLTVPLRARVSMLMVWDASSDTEPDDTLIPAPVPSARNAMPRSESFSLQTLPSTIYADTEPDDTLIPAPVPSDRNVMPRSESSSLQTLPSTIYTETYEVELQWESDFDQLQKMMTCKKHPGHTEFISIKNFEKKHLPPHYQHELLRDVIRCLSYLTVRLKVNKISTHRPPPPYPPSPRYDSLDRNCSINGSGHVSDAISCEHLEETCPCRSCKLSSNPKHAWGKVYIHTAAHVVHDVTEAEHTTCYIHYNNYQGEGKGFKIEGMESVEIDLKEDRCWMFCYTHDMYLVEQLHRQALLYEKLQNEVRNKYCITWVDVPTEKLVVVVSHPHGCGKYITVGESVERLAMDDDPDWAKYSYTAPTCPGSSGAPVFILGKHGWFDYHHHSGTTASGLNISTYGLF